ncbi:MAG: hypothetical protein AVO35_11855 [Candidatus Aegiribacteria sp. MLS_C]|nr:MAG: hypothetical protein AVO35_11855 [Candidatus Aegiribacteria sp. MLS_C]
MSAIGLLNEKPLHSSLKEWYSCPGDLLEVPVDGFVVDIVRGTSLIEIQTGGFHSIRSKLRKLLPMHEIRLVHPVPQEKWIVKVPQDGGEPSRRKSPKKGRVEDLFSEMVSFPDLLLDRNLSVEVLLTREEEILRYDGARGWRRRGWLVEERRLLEVVDSRLFTHPSQWLSLLPEGTAEFTTEDLAAKLRMRRGLAQKMAYCMRMSDIIVQVGRRGRSNLYSVAVPDNSSRGRGC